MRARASQALTTDRQMLSPWSGDVGDITLEDVTVPLPHYPVDTGASQALTTGRWSVHGVGKGRRKRSHGLWVRTREMSRLVGLPVTQLEQNSSGR